MAHGPLKAGELTAVVGDNSAHEGHRAGYNGVWSLRHAGCPRSLFVPSVAGLNHEHIFNGEKTATREVFFEPRNAPMSFRQVSDVEAELHQPPTPTYFLESWTTFKVVAPHYLDMTYRCVAHQHVFPRNYIGLFWASYIHAPEDKSIHFLSATPGQPAVWSQLCSQRHNDESTVRHKDDAVELTFASDSGEALYKNYSPLRYDSPFYYGSFEEHVWIVMADRPNGFRFTHSPTGGGADAVRRTTNPAWDFQFIISPYDVMKEYGFRVRTVFRPRCPRDEVTKEYERWHGGKP
jgi:hypothetical protein